MDIFTTILIISIKIVISTYVLLMCLNSMDELVMDVKVHFMLEHQNGFATNSATQPVSSVSQLMEM